ncbi:hypothetical protein E1193_19175 [Micromonospora sp. KC606]|uniref:hypothetical protein n=1 Tax=Micromonospora sp. KC606 TaxID=2530379 RepID=UPI0010540823|nr:hypothetical protein [Micromonospora sp. KC606]TDC79389.1 hypothetical protein E1193_19175 [Micromonospora sp. KC606]
MRPKLLRGAVAATLAVVVTLPLGAQPAQAFDVSKIVTVVKTAYELYKTFKGGGMSIDEATTKIIASINSAKTDIISQIDRVATAQARACAQSSIIDFADIQTFTQDTLQAYARDTTACVTLIDSLLDVVTDKGAADQLGFAINAVGPIALVARSRAGFTTAALLGTAVHGNDTTLTRIAPTCSAGFEGIGSGGPVNGARYRAVTTCTAYDGQRATKSITIVWPPTSNPFDVPGVSAQAASNTSYVQARAVLPILRSISA